MNGVKCQGNDANDRDYSWLSNGDEVVVIESTRMRFSRTRADSPAQELSHRRSLGSPLLSRQWVRWNFGRRNSTQAVNSSGRGSRASTR
jgi:hypothetical protein